MLRSAGPILSEATRKVKSSVIKEMPEPLQRHGIISFEGGSPSQDSFPTDGNKALVNEVHGIESDFVLRHGASKGGTLLRKLPAGRDKSHCLNVDADNLIIAAGSQQERDLLSGVLTDSGDYAICDLPANLVSLNAFRNNGSDIRGVPCDENGMLPDELERTENKLNDPGRKDKFIYKITGFQNPSGITIPEAGRENIIGMAGTETVVKCLAGAPGRHLIKN